MREEFGLVARRKWAASLLRNVKAYVDRKSISPDAPGFIRTPSGLVPINAGTSDGDGAGNYPFQISSTGTPAAQRVSFLPGTITSSLMDDDYDGTPTVNGTLISASITDVDGNEARPYLDVTSANMRAWYKTTWEGTSDGATPNASLNGAMLMTGEVILLEYSDPPTEVAPTIDPTTGNPDVTGEFYQQIGIVQDKGDSLYVFNDTVRSSHRVIFCTPDEFRPYPVT